MSLTCVYHRTQPMKVLEQMDADKLVAAGEWFNHPSCKPEKVEEAIKIEENNNERQIRRSTGKRRSNGKNTPRAL